MRALHLKQIGEVWYYQRRRPTDYSDVEPRALIRFSLKTKNFHEAKILAADFSLQFEEKWAKAKRRGVSLCSDDVARSFRTAMRYQSELGLAQRLSGELSDDELLQRMKVLIAETSPVTDQKALLGIVHRPPLGLLKAFDRFWEHIQDEWMRLSHDQQRVKRNVFLKSIRNFETAVGEIPLHQIERAHALKFRSWWMDRVKSEGLKPYTGNREINSLRRMVSVNFDIDSENKPNPFSRVRLKEEAEVARIPLSLEQIQLLLAPGALPDLAEDFRLLFRLLINTGMRPVEAIGLELSDINLEHEVPHAHVRKNSVRVLKTDHSERLLPLLGVSLDAAEDLIAQGGWGKRLGKNMYATTVINKALRKSGIVTDPRQSLYSLRHWFQDQLTKRDVVDRAQAQLMGHKFQRPKYGYGKDLTELREIIEPFAIR